MGLAGGGTTNTCNAGCIPEHVKRKDGQPLCCTEGQESWKCPRPAHYQCGQHRRKLWSVATGGAVQSSPTLSSDGKVVYVGSNDHSLYAVNASTGSEIWIFATGGVVYSSPVVNSNSKVVYVGSED